MDWLIYVDQLDISADQKQQGVAMYAAGRDAKAAIRWLHTHAEPYGVHPEHLAVIGSSAGAYLTMMLGVTEPGDYRDELSAEDDHTLASTNLGASSEVHTLVDLWGGPIMVDGLNSVWNLDRWDPTDTPVSIVHGTEDATVPFTEAEDIRDQYERTGAPYAFHPLEGYGHGAWDATVDGLPLSELAFDFVVETQGLPVEEGLE